MNYSRKCYPQPIYSSIYALDAGCCHVSTAWLLITFQREVFRLISHIVTQRNGGHRKNKAILLYQQKIDYESTYS